MWLNALLFVVPMLQRGTSEVVILAFPRARPLPEARMGVVAEAPVFVLSVFDYQ